MHHLKAGEADLQMAPDNKLVQGFWSSEMRQRHANEQEMTAILLSLETVAKDLSGKSVFILSDNVSSMAPVIIL